MKLSRYNVLQSLNSEYLIANTYSDSYLLVAPELYEMMTSIRQNPNSALELKKFHPTFYNELIKGNFLIDDNINELDNVVNRVNAMDSNDEHFSLTINPTMNCNFKCWYCYETHIKESKMDEETISKTKTFIKSICENKINLKSLTVSWFGGEPLLYFEKVIVPILHYADNICRSHNIYFSTNFTTNGLLISQKTINILKRYNVSNLQITLDGNEELHNTIRYISDSRDSYREIVNNIMLLCKNRINVLMRINYTMKTLEKICDIIHDFVELTEEDKTFMRVNFQQVWQDMKSNDVDNLVNHVKQTFRNNGFYVEKQEALAMNSSCYADKINEAVINYNGDVYKCTAREFSDKNKEGILESDGNVIWNQNNEIRRKAKLTNKPCLECSILPLCGGGCSQHAYENYGRDYCVHNFDENEKKDVVKKRFLSMYA